MAGEPINKPSTTWQTVIASSSPTNGAFDAATKTAINATSLSANEQLYTLLDFHLNHTAGTATENATIDLYRISNADSGSTPTPAGSYKQTRVGRFVLDNVASQHQYIFGVANVDANDKFITQNNGGATLTYSVKLRTRTLIAAT